MQIKSVPVDRGMGWLLDGFGYFTKSPGAWLGVTVTMFIMFIVVSIIPFGGLVMELLWPVLVGGLMLGCQAQDEGGGNQFRFAHLFDGFAIGGSALYVIGALYLAGMILIAVTTVAICIALLGMSGMMTNIEQAMAGDLQAIAPIMMQILLVLLVFLALLVPLIMAVWFAPALVIQHNCSGARAMALSFQGCLANIVPFLLYGVVGLVFAILASIPLALGWLVLMPMITASMWIGAKEIYSADPA